MVISSLSVENLFLENQDNKDIYVKKKQERKCGAQTFDMSFEMLKIYCS